jgi:hypothetical protein
MGAATDGGGGSGLARLGTGEVRRQPQDASKIAWVGRPERFAQVVACPQAKSVDVSQSFLHVAGFQ